MALKPSSHSLKLNFFEPNSPSNPAFWIISVGGATKTCSQNIRLIHQLILFSLKTEVKKKGILPQKKKESYLVYCISSQTFITTSGFFLMERIDSWEMNQSRTTSRNYSLFDSSTRRAVCWKRLERMKHGNSLFLTNNTMPLIDFKFLFFFINMWSL